MVARGDVAPGDVRLQVDEIDRVLAYHTEGVGPYIICTLETRTKSVAVQDEVRRLVSETFADPLAQEWRVSRDARAVAWPTLINELDAVVKAHSLPRREACCPQWPPSAA
jgi:hypothetical protein